MNTTRSWCVWIKFLNCQLNHPSLHESNYIVVDSLCDDLLLVTLVHILACAHYQPGNNLLLKPHHNRHVWYQLAQRVLAMLFGLLLHFISRLQLKGSTRKNLQLTATCGRKNKQKKTLLHSLSNCFTYVHAVGKDEWKVVTDCRAKLGRSRGKSLQPELKKLKCPPQRVHYPQLTKMNRREHVFSSH